jgi:hypothetical protein
LKAKYGKIKSEEILHKIIKCRKKKMGEKVVFNLPHKSYEVIKKRDKRKIFTEEKNQMKIK